MFAIDLVSIRQDRDEILSIGQRETASKIILLSLRQNGAAALYACNRNPIAGIRIARILWGATAARVRISLRGGACVVHIDDVFKTTDRRRIGRTDHLQHHHIGWRRQGRWV